MHAFVRFALVRRAAALCVLAAATTLAACNSERAIGPSADLASASMARGGNSAAPIGGTLTTSGSALLSKTALAWPTTRPGALTRTYTVQNTVGSILDFPEVGLKVLVPSGALPTPTMAITITALPGRGVAYSFQPHGTVFLKPLVVQQDLLMTSWAGNTGVAIMGAGYFASDDQVNSLTGVVLLNEQLTAKIIDHRLYFVVRHFSGYMVSMD